MKLFGILVGVHLLSRVLFAHACELKLFSVTMDKTLRIVNVLDNLAQSCGLTIIIQDEMTQKRLEKSLYYVKLQDATLKTLLDVVLTENNLHYRLEGNRLSVLYRATKTFKVNYVAGSRTGKSNAHIQIANANSVGAHSTKLGESAHTTLQNGGKTGISIESNEKFSFWERVESEIERIVLSEADTESTRHYTKRDTGWVDKEGKFWKYHPLTPIVNAEAGLITVTGTPRQLKRVEHYIERLAKQITQQVLIDVRILTVTFDNSHTMGVDWNQIYNLQDVTLNTLAFTQRNIKGVSPTPLGGLGQFEILENAHPQSAKAILLQGSTHLSNVVRFLGTQGKVKSLSSPRVMTLNNQPALISVGKELFYKTTTATTSNSAGSSVAVQGEQVHSVFAGILLDITPQISSEGLITLKINPSISETVDTNIQGSSGVREVPPDLIRRQIASVIQMRHGERAVLGGLISSKHGFKSHKLPLLGELPLVGRLFHKEEVIEVVEELVLIITPHIVSSQHRMSLKELGYSKLDEK
jgi:general secretion pathway protein D